MAEMSGFWSDPETGLGCKCRPDWLAMADGIVTGIVDVKTCVDASAEGFASFNRHARLRPAGGVLSGRRQGHYGQDAPRSTSSLSKRTLRKRQRSIGASEDVIDVGRAKFRGALQLLQWCRANKPLAGVSAKRGDRNDRIATLGGEL
jgi:hypothetical protein